MFKLNPNPTFTAAASISVPGSKAPVSIEIEFKHLSKKEIKAYFEGLSGKSDDEALGEIVVGWKGIDSPFSQEALATFLDKYPKSAAELFETFRFELMEARAKN